MNDKEIEALWLRVTGFSADDERADIAGFARALLSASIADTAGAKADEALSLANADWRNLYEMVWGHECSFKCFMATVDDLAASPSPSVADAAGASERERFEAWAIEQGYAFCVNDEFTARPAYNTGLMWAAWKAAIAKESGND